LQFAGIARDNFDFDSVWRSFRRIALGRARWNAPGGCAGEFGIRSIVSWFLVLPAAWSIKWVYACVVGRPSNLSCPSWKT